MFKQTGLLLFSILATACGSGSNNNEPSNSVTDTTPDPISISAITEADPDTWIASSPVIITGIDTQISISVEGGEYSLNGGNYTSAQGQVGNNDQIQLRISSPANFSTQASMTLYLGQEPLPFTIYTRDADVTPDDLTIPSIDNARYGQIYDSEAVVISGLEQSVTLSISNGKYSLNGSEFSSSPAQVFNGDTLIFRGNAPSISGSSDTVQIQIGENSYHFSITAQIDTQAPEVWVDFPAEKVSIETDSMTVRGRATDESGISTLSVNGIMATTDDNFTTWKVRVPLSAGINNLHLSASDNSGNTYTEDFSQVDSQPFITSPYAAILDQSGKKLIVLDNGRIYSIDINTRLRSSILPGPSHTTEKPVIFSEICTNSDNDLFISRLDNKHTISKINQKTGTISTIIQTTDTNGNLPGTLYCDSNSKYLYTNLILENTGETVVISIDPDNNTWNILPGSDTKPAMGWIDDITSDGEYLYILDTGTDESDKIYRVALDNGQRELVASNDKGSGGLLRNISNLTYNRNNDTLLAYDGYETYIPTTRYHSIYQIDKNSGDRTIVTDWHNPTFHEGISYTTLIPVPDTQDIISLGINTGIDRINTTTGNTTAFDIIYNAHTDVITQIRGSYASNTRLYLYDSSQIYSLGLEVYNTTMLAALPDDLNGSISNIAYNETSNELYFRTFFDRTIYRSNLSDTIPEVLVSAADNNDLYSGFLENFQITSEGDKLLFRDILTYRVVEVDLNTGAPELIYDNALKSISIKAYTNTPNSESTSILFVDDSSLYSINSDSEVRRISSYAYSIGKGVDFSVPDFLQQSEDQKSVYLTRSSSGSLDIYKVNQESGNREQILTLSEPGFEIQNIFIDEDKNTALITTSNEYQLIQLDLTTGQLVHFHPKRPEQ